MSKTPLLYTIVDAFTSTSFSGNPASVIILPPAHHSLPSSTLLQIAGEFNLSETAFLIPIPPTEQQASTTLRYGLRWFTPAIEVSLCGHATLASARVIFSTPEGQLADRLEFDTLSGTLVAKKVVDAIELDFPESKLEDPTPDELAKVSEVVSKAAQGGVSVRGVKKAGFFLLVEVDPGFDLEGAVVDADPFRQLPYKAVILTSTRATSFRSNTRFISRVFGPNAGVEEDPVTGSAHCVLAPYWSQVLNIQPGTLIETRQASKRGGDLDLIWDQKTKRVRIQGNAVVTMRGELYLTYRPLPNMSNPPLLYTIVDAFTSTPFSGNPASIILLPPTHYSLPTASLLQIAAEFNLSETAFLIPRPASGQQPSTTLRYGLRWFTPTIEIRLCGHATLASARVIFSTPEGKLADRLEFDTLSGTLVAKKVGDAIELDFPAVSALEDLATQDDVAKVSKVLSEAIGGEVGIRAVKNAGFYWLVEVDPGFDLEGAARQLSCEAIIITCSRSTALRPDARFISRVFAPLAGIAEDPVCGSAHCVLAPYWSQVLDIPPGLLIEARQVSKRGGDLDLVLDKKAGRRRSKSLPPSSIISDIKMSETMEMEFSKPSNVDRFKELLREAIITEQPQFSYGSSTYTNPYDPPSMPTLQNIRLVSDHNIPGYLISTLAQRVDALKEENLNVAALQRAEFAVRSAVATSGQFAIKQEPTVLIGFSPIVVSPVQALCRALKSDVYYQSCPPILNVVPDHAQTAFGGLSIVAKLALASITKGLEYCVVHSLEHFVVIRFTAPESGGPLEAMISDIIPLMDNKPPIIHLILALVLDSKDNSLRGRFGLDDFEILIEDANPVPAGGQDVSDQGESEEGQNEIGSLQGAVPSGSQLQGLGLFRSISPITEYWVPKQISGGTLATLLNSRNGISLLWNMKHFTRDIFRPLRRNDSTFWSNTTPTEDLPRLIELNSGSDGAPPQPAVPFVLLLESRVSQYTVDAVYQGRIVGHSERIFAKVMPAGRMDSELEIWRKLRNLTGTRIPGLFGAYALEGQEGREDTGALIQQYPGKGLRSFEGLSSKQREELYLILVQVHKAGVEHGDLRPENIALRSDGHPVLFNFSQSQHHACPGEEKCAELVSLRSALKLPDQVQADRLRREPPLSTSQKPDHQLGGSSAVVESS
ncbi:hypothetical protein FRB90_005690 [Tulasnella sp. 427]|nr:hypothetical protein FRB90_005690 [Tulasnella sp. 427]